MTASPTGSMFDTCKTISSKVAAERAGLHLQAKGSRYWSNCFMHEDKTASLVFYPDGGWYCFSCHKGGDAVKLYELLFDITPGDAAQRLLSDFTLTDTSVPVKKVVTGHQVNKAVSDIKQRRLDELIRIKHRAHARVNAIQGAKTRPTDKDLADIDNEVAKSSAAQDLIDRIELMTESDLLAWIQRGGLINDL